MSDGHTRRASGHVLPVVDQEALTEVLEKLNTHYGSQAKAARFLGITADRYYRLRTGQQDGLTFDIYARIHRALMKAVLEPQERGVDSGRVKHSRARKYGRAPRPVLEFIVPPNDRAIESRRSRDGISREEAERILIREREQEARRLEERYDDLVGTFERSVLTEDHDFIWVQYRLWMAVELARLRERAMPVFEALWDHLDYRPRIQRFLEQVERDADRPPDEDDERCWLALFRVMAPLGDTEPTWNVEQSWRDLHKLGELGRYLDLAFDREELLLQPRQDHLRVVKRGKMRMSRREAMDLMAAMDAFFEENPERTMQGWNEAVDEARRREEEAG